MERRSPVEHLWVTRQVHVGVCSCRVAGQKGWSQLPRD